MPAALRGANGSAAVSLMPGRYSVRIAGETVQTFDVEIDPESRIKLEVML